MAIENTSLYQEFKQIVETGVKPVHYYWSCEVNNGEEIIEAYKVLNVEIQRVYDNSYSDAVKMEVMIPRGKYLYRILPFYEDLRITLKKTPMGEVGIDEDSEKSIDSLTMRAYILNEGVATLQTTDEAANTESTSDLLGFVKVEFQLVDLALEQLRMITVGGIFRNAVPADVLRALMGVSCKNIRVDNESLVRGIDLVEPSNAKKRDHVIIPHGTLLTELPEYIQNNCGGVYSAGIGNYLQRGIWYIYPEFDITRFDKTTRSLTILNVPPNRFPGIERTFFKDGDKLIIMTTGESQYHDDFEALQLNYGNGVRFANADKIIGGYTKTSGNRTTVSREDNSAEFIAIQRKTGLNNVFFSEDRITSNPFKETSKLARRNGGHLVLTWDNSDGDLIYPGMPVRYLYTKEEDVNEVYGIVLRSQTFIGAVGSGPTISRHKSTTIITLFIQPI